MTEDLADMSDAVLVVGIGRYQSTYLGEVYRRHGGAAHRLASRLLQDAALAQEVTQEVFLDLWKRPESFDSSRGSLRSFLLVKTHGRAVDLVRSERARRDREEKEALRAAPAFGSYDLEREVWDLTVADRVQEAMAELPDGERQAIHLAYFGGHTYREVAKLLDQPEGTVKSRIRHGLRALRDKLADVHPDARADRTEAV